MYICIKKKPGNYFRKQLPGNYLKKHCKYNINYLKKHIMKNLILTQEQINIVKTQVNNQKARSAWEKGVLYYAYFLLENYEEFLSFEKVPFNENTLLNGAYSWRCYSYGGSALISNTQIAAILCNKTELVKSNYGLKEPNKNETWLDVQARALKQAYDLVLKLIILAFVPVNKKNN